MRVRLWLCLAAILLAATAQAGKKEKQTLPAYVLKAQTVFVMILPDAGEPLNDPTANRKALDEVEKALMKWGRFRLALNVEAADLVIAVRKGTGKLAAPTVGGGPVDSRPVILDKTDNQIRIGGQQGRPPDPTQAGSDTTADSRAHTQTEIGAADDVLQVYQGGGDYPLDRPPAWKYIAKDALRPPDVRAVDEFHKAVDEAEKAAAQQQKKKTP